MNPDQTLVSQPYRLLRHSRCIHRRSSEWLPLGEVIDLPPPFFSGPAQVPMMSPNGSVPPIYVPPGYVSQVSVPPHFPVHRHRARRLAERHRCRIRLLSAAWLPLYSTRS